MNIKWCVPVDSKQNFFFSLSQSFTWFSKMYSMFLEIKLIQIKTLHVHIQILQWWCTPLSLKAGMESLKRRLSFRKKKNHVPECSKPHQWQEDEKKVRDGTCSFQVRVKNTTDTSLNYCSVNRTICTWACTLLSALCMYGFILSVLNVP